MIVITAPNSTKDVSEEKMRIFLAGSIEQDTADQWQKRLIEEFHDVDVVFLNPRRDNWDVTLKNTKDEPEFVNQVNWELNGIQNSDLVIFHFDPNTKSPVTMMEFGIVAGTYFHDAGIPTIVHCPDGFWRQGNVEILCNRLEIPMYRDWDKFVAYLRVNILAWKTFGYA